MPTTPRTYVAVDVETTGLDPRRDAIIEVAAVTFQGNDILNEFSSLVNPLRDIPTFITDMTGITSAMVSDAPTMSALRPRLKTQLGDHILIGHNIEFDLGFLQEAWLGAGNHRLDTLTLASILVPEARRLSLGELARFLNFPSADGHYHRARHDAEQTIELFLALRERALQLSLAQLDEIVQAGRSLGWPETIFFEDALAERARHAFEEGEMRLRGQLSPLYKPPTIKGRSLVPAEEPTVLDVEMLARMIEPGGHFSQLFPAFEYRPQQVEMLAGVAEAFNQGDHVLVEAGTGTGKSVGYLLPAVFWATQNDRRVVISTNTINLQDQLIQKDIPTLQQILPMEFRAAVRKGRGNYLCTRLFQQMRRTGPGNADEMALYARILLWLGQTETGDVAEISLRSPGERLAWSKLNGENDVCKADDCAQENCPLHIARRRAEQAHLIVVNHALLLADVATGGMVLPEYSDLIIDEAHHLEAAVTDALSFRADKRGIETILEEVLRPRAGMVANAQQRVAAAAPAEIGRSVDEYADRMRREAQIANDRLEEFFALLSDFLKNQIKGRSQFTEQVRLIQAVRVQPGYSLVEETWVDLSRSLKLLAEGFIKLSSSIHDIGAAYDLEDGDDLAAALQSTGSTLNEIRQNLDATLLRPSADYIYWAELASGSTWERVSLHAAPLHIGPLVAQHIWEAKETVVLTSATMRTAAPGGRGPTFTYLRNRLQANEASELAVGSPFDYKNSTLLYLVTDIPEPNQPGYQKALEEAIIEVAVALGGRTMVLFTANNHLSQTAQAIEKPLARHEISTLAQTSGSSRLQLLDEFKQVDSRSVLLGTRSFWEGVDVPGVALQALLIARLPFDVPSDPIFAARSETFDSPFFEYSVPEAVLRFRQGFGRLIRRQSDEGIVAILDKRVLTKRYGQLFIDALPECTVLRQRKDRLGELTLRWLNRERIR